jgi:hypothetical protein
MFGDGDTLDDEYPPRATNWPAFCEDRKVQQRLIVGIDIAC